MVEAQASGFVAECFWPDVNERAVRAVDERIAACVEALDGAGVRVRYLGSILLREDEVVLCQFEGTEAAVREVVERADVPFERILESTTYINQRGRTS
jgi:hypothetical protein